jgi:hypothetical protein
MLKPRSPANLAADMAHCAAEAKEAGETKVEGTTTPPLGPPDAATASH